MAVNINTNMMNNSMILCLIREMEWDENIEKQCGINVLSFDITISAISSYKRPTGL